MTDYDKVLESKKSHILNGIDELLEKGSDHKETLELMKELLKKARVRRSIEEYINEQLEEP